MTPHCAYRPREAGSVLIVAIVFVAILSIGTSAALRHLHMTMAEIKRQENVEAAPALAEAGLEKAFAMLRAHPGAYAGESDTPLGDGRFSVAVTRGPRAGVYAVRSEGIVADGVGRGEKQVIVAEMEIQPGGGLRTGPWRVEKKQEHGWIRTGTDATMQTAAVEMKHEHD